MSYKAIRDILEYHLTQVTDVPNIVWESTNFVPTNGTPYVKTFFVPTTTRPSVMGETPQLRYDGLFRVFPYYPEGNGPQDVETCATNILTTFAATNDLSFNSETLRVEYSERTQIRQESPWVFIPITISWYYYT